MSKKYAIFAIMLLAGFVLGTSVLESTTSAVKELCRGIMSLLPIAAMLMIVLAGVIYAAGQIMGAETRARANVWATACLTGALIAVLIAVITPPMLNAIYNPAEAGSGISAQICD